MQTSKIIFHIDMNSFFASCEMADNEDLIGKAVVIAHNDPFQRSIIVSPSYEARKYGIKATMRVNEAFNLCKDIVVVEPNYQLYHYYSNAFKEYLLKITDKVEMASIDEAFVDVTDIVHGADAIDLAHKIQKDIYDIYKLPTSIGIAPNKLLAKMASDMKKPMGITILRRREIDKYMWPLPIGDLMGVGKKTLLKMDELKIKTIGDLANYQNLDLLKKILGNATATSLYAKSHGIDDSTLETEEQKSSSTSAAHTFYLDTYDEKIIFETIKMLSNSISHRLESNEKKAQTIGVNFRYSNGTQFSRSKTVNNPINESYEIYKTAIDIFNDYYDNINPIRLIGVFANRLIDDKNQVKQISIFDDFDKLNQEEQINKIVKNVNKIFGDGSIKKGIK